MKNFESNLKNKIKNLYKSDCNIKFKLNNEIPIILEQLNNNGGFEKLTLLISEISENQKKSTLNELNKIAQNNKLDFKKEIQNNFIELKNNYQIILNQVFENIWQNIFVADVENELQLLNNQKQPLANKQIIKAISSKNITQKQNAFSNRYLNHSSFRKKQNMQNNKTLISLNQIEKSDEKRKQLLQTKESEFGFEIEKIKKNLHFKPFNTIKNKTGVLNEQNVSHQKTSKLDEKKTIIKTKKIRPFSEIASNANKKRETSNSKYNNTMKIQKLVGIKNVDLDSEFLYESKSYKFATSKKELQFLTNDNPGPDKYSPIINDFQHKSKNKGISFGKSKKTFFLDQFIKSDVPGPIYTKKNYFLVK